MQISKGRDVSAHGPVSLESKAGTYKNVIVAVFLRWRGNRSCGTDCSSTCKPLVVFLWEENWDPRRSSEK